MRACVCVWGGVGYIRTGVIRWRLEGCVNSWFFFGVFFYIKLQTCLLGLVGY